MTRFRQQLNEDKELNKIATRSKNIQKTVSFFCYICGDSYKTKELINRHLKSVHKIAKENMDVTKIQEDRNQNNPNPSKKSMNYCRDCSFTTSSDREIDEHYNSFHLGTNQVASCSKQYL